MTTAAYPIAPAVTKRRGTLLDAANVQEGIELLDGRDLYESFNCLQFGATADFCGPNAKDLDGVASWVDGFRFAAYGGVVCKSVGLDQNSMKEKVRQAFETGESTAVERGLMTTRFVANADPENGWAAPVDITPAGGAVKPAVGVGLLEGYAGSVYVGAPTIHMPITIASLLLGVDGAVFEGDMLRTKTGSKVAAGAGYDFPNNGPTGAAAAAGERWLYATGEVVVKRGEVIVLDAMDYSTNEVFVLAERGYVASTECFVAAVRVQVA